MDRNIFRGLIMGGSFLYFPCEATFHDPVSFAHNVASQGQNLAKYGEMIQSGAKQLETAKEMASTASDALNTANKAFSELQNMNSVLGSPLKSNVLSRLMGLKGATRSYGNLLSSLSNDNADSLGGINRFSRQQFGTQDQSRVLYAKNYFQRKFFSEKSSTINVQKARQIKYDRQKASQESVLTTLAVSHTHKENLKKDHEDLVKISSTTSHSGEMNHQAVVQTKLLERIAENLEKLILLQAQQLDFMAKTYMEDRGVGLGEAREPKGDS